MGHARATGGVPHLPALSHSRIPRASVRLRAGTGESARTSGDNELILRHGAVLSLAAIALIVSAIAGYGQKSELPIAGAVLGANPTGSSTWAFAFPEPEIEYAPPAAEATTPTAVPTPTPEPWGTMIAREGDTFSALAEWFGITAEDIAAANGVTIDYIFHPGDELAIPVPASQFVMPPVPEIYVYEEPAEPVYEAPVITEAATPESAPPPAARVYGSAEVLEAICSLPWPCDTMVRIASCESGLNPNSYNPAGYYGLFQIAGLFDGWNDPWVNSRVAYETKYLPALNGGGDGLSPWPNC